MASNGKKHMAFCYTSEAEYQLISKELHDIGETYRINRRGKVSELPPYIRSKWRHLRGKYAEMSRQRYLVTVPPKDRKRNTQLVNNAHLHANTP